MLQFLKQITAWLDAGTTLEGCGYFVLLLLIFSINCLTFFNDGDPSIIRNTYSDSVSLYFSSMVIESVYNFKMYEYDKIILKNFCSNFSGQFIHRTRELLYAISERWLAIFCCWKGSEARRTTFNVWYNVQNSINLAFLNYLTPRLKKNRGSF